MASKRTAPTRPARASRYWDERERRIVDNRYLIANLIQCDRDTPRVLSELDPFEIQERVIENILETHEARQALEAAPQTVDPLQQTVATTLQEYINRPDVDRRRVIAAVRLLARPLPTVAIRELRSAYRDFQSSTDISALLSLISRMEGEFSAAPAREGTTLRRLRREDLRLICFDHLSSGA